MGKYTGPKHRLARREGINILEKESRSLDRRLSIPPGIHGKKGRRKISEYGQQLREKQKLKRMYGLYEKQFQKYVTMAQKKRQNTPEALLQLLETRLDSFVFRAGLAKTRTQARQMVSHRHIIVNGQKVNIPSYAVRDGETVEISPKFLQKNEVLKQWIGEKEVIPSFIERKDMTAKLLRVPTEEEVQNPVDYQLVIEFYSR